MQQEKLEIKIISNSEVVCTYTPKSKNEAKTLYYRLSGDAYRYTQLVVNGREYTTGRAEKYFGKMEKPKGMPIF